MDSDSDSNYNTYSSGDEVASDDDTCHEKQQSSYIVLSESDVRQRQENDITSISSVLSVSRVESIALLRHFNWSVSKVNEQWFADEDRVRKAVGIFNNPIVDNENTTQLTCNICFDTFPKDEIYSVSCGHPFCGSCWEGYITTSINDGPGCLTLRCPEPGCGAAVGQDMVDSSVSEDDRKKYGGYVLRSYIEDNRKTKWCPAPGCDYAVEFVACSASNDVICSCKYGFCWSCTEEAHRPVDCETVEKWIVKNSSESENANWIMVNTKPCPECKRNIEKNDGCMHMTCSPPCRYHFCWLCLGPWSAHGYSACNGYKKGTEDEEERERAKMSLKRYTHYYERWSENNSSRKKAVADLERMKSVHMEELSEIQCKTEAELKFLVEAWLQIVECRRVLKWTYAYGYYLDEEEAAKKHLFEYLQGEAEAGLERLHHCAEKELEVYLTAEGPSDKFNEFRTKLVGLTSVTRTFFGNLVRALENGLSELDSYGGGSQATGLKRMGVGKGKQKLKRLNATSTSTVPSTTTAVIDDDDDYDYWSCDRCTYMNVESAMACQMCSEES